jgi:HEAT repeat protein
MDTLKDFDKRDMIEQMMILDEIKETKNKSAIPALLEMFAAKKCDQATHEMLYHTLFDLMIGDADALAMGLRHPAQRVKLLSIRRAKKPAVPAIIPRLMELLYRDQEPQILEETLRTLAAYNNENLLEELIPFLFHDNEVIIAAAMNALISTGNEEVGAILMDIINGDENLADPDKECQISTILAVKHLGNWPDEMAKEFLQAKVNHPDPAFRKAVAAALAE